ncbi:MAG: SelB C-terminal domain-containing protein, partial [Desulfomonilaceae bacterium]
LVRSGDIAVDGDVVRLSSHQIRLGDADKDVKERLVRMLTDGGNTPPTMKEILNKTGWDQKQIRTLLGILEKENKVVRVSEELYYAREFIDQIKSKLRDFFSKEAYLTPSRFAEITGASRKFNIPLLEYLDRERFTVRVGDQRVLRGSGSSGAGGKPA